MEIPQYGILNTSGLLLLIVLAVVACISYYAAATSRRLAASLGVPSCSTNMLRSALGISIALLLSFAIMRPYWGAEDIKVNSSGDDVIFLVDISRSMYASDIPPSRLEVAKRKIKDLVTKLSTSGQAARFGITVFAGDGYTVCPITTDRGVVAQFVETISPDLVSSLGSNLKGGIEAALSRFDEAAKSHSRVLLLSDGDDDFFDVTRAVREIYRKGVRFDVLGLGTPQGSTIQLPNGSVVVDETRKPVVSALKEASLEAIARAGGGLYVRATLNDSDVETLASSRMVVSQGGRIMTDSTIRSYRELGPWVVLVALCSIVLSAFFVGAGPLACVAFSLVFLHTSSRAVAENTSQPAVDLAKASPFELYEQGSYQAAANRFTQDLNKNPTDRAVKLGLASSLYRLGKYQESEKLFGELAAEATNGRHYYEAIYNQGNAQLKTKRYQEAIQSFLQALDVKPNDEQASHNLAVARALLEEEKRRALEPTPTPTATPTATQTSETHSSPQNTPPPSPQPSESANPSPVHSPEPSPSHDSGGSPMPTDGTASPSTSGEPTGTSEPTGTVGAAQTSETDSTPAQATAIATGEVTPTANQVPAQPSPTEERLKEALDRKPEPAQPSDQPSQSPESSSFPEVDAWLQSLPESPLLIRRHRGTPSSNGQTW